MCYGLEHMRARWVSAIVLGVTLAPIVKAQELEAASIKPHAPHEACAASQALPGGRLRVSCYTLALIIREALDVAPNRVKGGPGWVRNDRWDIVAKSTGLGGKSEGAIYREMLREVAVERFHVKLRQEFKEEKGLALVVSRRDKLGPEIRRNTGAPYAFDLKAGPSLHAQNVSMQELARRLRLLTARGVKDETGLPGTYDFVLRWTPLHEEEIKDPKIAKDAPTVFTALQEQLGLKLVADKIQGEFYVIEQAQRPDPN